LQGGCCLLLHVSVLYAHRSRASAFDSCLRDYLSVHCFHSPRKGYTIIWCAFAFLPTSISAIADAQHTLMILTLRRYEVRAYLYLRIWLHPAADVSPPLLRHLLSASCACLAVALVNPTPQKEHFSSSRPLRFSR
jgi:hypothetical protein